MVIGLGFCCCGRVTPSHSACTLLLLHAACLCCCMCHCMCCCIVLHVLQHVPLHVLLPVPLHVLLHCTACAAACMCHYMCCCLCHCMCCRMCHCMCCCIVLHVSLHVLHVLLHVPLLLGRYMPVHSLPNTSCYCWVWEGTCMSLPPSIDGSGVCMHACMLLLW